MFAGTYRVRVDEKGRLAIPAGFRKQLTEGSYISVGQDNVLTIYPPEIWESLGRQLQDPLLGPEQRALSRTLYSKAVPCEFDGQGRGRSRSTAPSALEATRERCSRPSHQAAGCWRSTATPRPSPKAGASCRKRWSSRGTSETWCGWRRRTASSTPTPSSSTSES